MTPKFHTLTILDITREAEDAVSISFHIPSDLTEDYAYVSGQYLTFRATINNEDIRRSYSLCSAPFENQWRVAVKQVENGQFSTYASNELKTGMKLEVMTPTGTFKFIPEPNSSKSHVLFASGSGITPILSIAKTALHEEPNCDVTLFFGNKGFASVIFREEIEALKNQYMGRLRVVHIFSREGLGNAIQKGRIDEKKTNELFKAFLAHTEIDNVYICGPEQMILGVKDGLIANNVDEHKIHFELFTTPTGNKVVEAPKDEPKIDSNIKIILDGDEIDLHLLSTGINILDAAQEAGADLPYACKGGVCCTCKAKIIEGSVRMDVNYGLEADEVEAGYILTCQSHPTSEKLVVSFDE
ncbi:MAG: phenylacetate-CoA oxygenase/reductase subunit PaaK [Crocinitomicaceae bacterium]